MQKTPLIVTIIIVISILAGYFIYDKITYSTKPSLSMFVPSGAFMVYEVNQLKETFDSWVQSETGKSFTSTSFHASILNLFNGLDTIKGVRESKLLNRPVLISMHVISKDDFDFIYYVSLTDSDTKLFFELLKNLQRDGFNQNSRLFDGLQLTELTKDDIQFSYIVYEDHLILSKTAFLIEDVVRTINSVPDLSFFYTNSDLSKLPRIQNDEGNLYLNLHHFFRWTNSFTEDIRTFDSYKQFGNSALLDVKLSNSSIIFDGFTSPSAKQEDYLHLFNSQDLGDFGIKRYIPSRASLVYKMSINDAGKLKIDLQKYLEKFEPFTLDSARRFYDSYNFDINRFYNWVGSEVAICIAELYGSKAQRIVYIKANEINDGLNQFNSLADKITLAREDSVFVDKFGDYVIKEIGIKDFPKKLLGTFFGGFDRTYFTLIDDYFVLSDNLDGLKLLISDFESENTWGHSIEWNNFISSTLSETNLSIYINTIRAWNIMLPQLSEKWRKFATENQQAFLSLDKASIQFSRVDDRYFTNVVFNHNAKNSRLPAKGKRYSSVRETILNDKISSRPIAVRNHIDSSIEILLQDSLNQLNLISAKGDVLWKLKLSHKIIDEITQIDFYKNSKLQFFFLTADGSIHVVDRLGRYVENYPVKTNSDQPSNAVVVDYDNSKNYRWLITDQSGDIYMYSKDGQVLEGWNPKQTGSSLSASARHYRIRGRDYILAMQQQGKIFLYNRRAEMQNGFPLDISGRLSQGVYLTPGLDQANTFFTLVTSDGILLKFNLNGQVISRDQLYKPMRDSRYWMVMERQGKSFIIVRQEGGRIALLDAAGNELFQKDYISSSTLEIQYFDFGSGRKIYTVTDREQEFSYIYDQSGSLINQQPIESSFTPAIIFSESTGAYTVYNADERKLQLLSF
mgnify:CR=1 FL=1